MAGQIQKIAGGLLGFFQIKTAGKTLSDMTDQLLATLALESWFLETNAETLAATALAIVAPSTTFLATVPQNEFWYVSRFSSLVTNLAAGETPLITPVVLYPQASSVLVLGSATAGGGATTNDGAAFLNGPIFLPPGAQIGTRITGVFVSVDLQHIARLTRLPA